MKYIPYLVIFVGMIFFLIAILTKYYKRKSLTDKFIDKIKFMHSMFVLLLITGSILCSVGLLSLLRILSINLLVSFIPCIGTLYWLKAISIDKKYGPPKKK